MKKLLNLLIPCGISALFVVTLLALAGCDTVTKYDNAGNITEKQKNSILKDDTIVNASNATGIVIATSYDSASGNMTPTARILTGGDSFAKQNKDCKKIVFTSTASAGILNSMTSATAESNTKLFIGAEGDTGAGAAAFIDALARLKMAENGTAPASQSANILAITDSAGTIYNRYAFVDNADTAYAWRSSADSATIIYTASKSPAVGDTIYSDSDMKTKFSVIKSRTAE